MILAFVKDLWEVVSSKHLHTRLCSTMVRPQTYVWRRTVYPYPYPALPVQCVGTCCIHVDQAVLYYAQCGSWESKTFTINARLCFRLQIIHPIRLMRYSCKGACHHLATSKTWLERGDTLSDVFVCEGHAVDGACLGVSTCAGSIGIWWLRVTTLSLYTLLCFTHFGFLSSECKAGQQRRAHHPLWRPSQYCASVSHPTTPS